MTPALAFSDLYVDLANPNCPGTGTAIDPYCSIQDAVNASTDGDMIHVSPGQYFENVIVEMRDITLASTDGPKSTTIDAAGSGSALLFRNANGTQPVVNGFTLRGGTGTEQRGGGVYIDGASPTLHDCIITENHTLGRGGGVYARNFSTSVFDECEFYLNSSAIDGGGMFQSGGTLVLTDCLLHWNSATDCGGGLYTRNDATVTIVASDVSNNYTELQDGAGIYANEADLHISESMVNRNFSGRDGSGLALHNNTFAEFNECLLLGNRAVMDGGAVHISASHVSFDLTDFVQNSCGRNGGGICVINNSYLSVTNALLRRNHSKGCHGGAIYMDSVDDAHFHTCKFLTNKARHDGGGVYAVNCSDSTFDYCAFGKNSANTGRGGAFHLTSTSPMMDHCTFSLNVGSVESCAIYGRNISQPTIKNSIMWGDLGGELILTIGHKAPGTGNNTTDITYTDIEGMWHGTNNFDADPLFVNPLNGNYHIRIDSPVRGQADDGSDLGAYPFGS